MLNTARRWFDDNIVELGREMRLSYLPPLMVYMAAGISGLTGIVGTFFVKEYLGLSAEFLAALGFWVGIPWAVKMPLGHIVDLIWRHKSGLVYLGAGLIATSLLIMVGLIGDPDRMRAIMPVPAWYVLAALLAPIGYVLQDVVADAMTVEAVPRVDAAGRQINPARRKLMNTTVQTLGRVAIIGGSVVVALINVYLFRNVEALSQPEKAADLPAGLRRGPRHPGDLGARRDARRYSAPPRRPPPRPPGITAGEDPAICFGAGSRRQNRTRGFSVVDFSSSSSHSASASPTCVSARRSSSPARSASLSF